MRPRWWPRPSRRLLAQAPQDEGIEPAKTQQDGSFSSAAAPLGRRVAVPVERLIVRCDHHALDAEMVVETLGAEFAPDAGIVNAAPGRGRIETVMVVDPDDAGLDAGCEPMGARDVAGAGRRRQPERGIIWQARE